MLRKVLLTAPILFVTISCETPKPTDGSEIDSGNFSENVHKTLVAATQLHGLADYRFKSKPFKAEWIACKAKEAKGAVLATNFDFAGFTEDKFCEDWLAQAFLTSGLNIIAVNRPGFGKSSGTADFSGPQSVEAILGGLAGAQASLKDKTAPVGIWGYSSGAIAAGFVAPKIAGLQWAILGGGIYDFDETLEQTQDEKLKKQMTEVTKTFGAHAGEDRSIAYDVSGMPKKVTIYHGNNDQSVPVTLATKFHQTLSANQVTSNLRIVDGLGHDIPPASHREILEATAKAALQ